VNRERLDELFDRLIIKLGSMSREDFEDAEMKAIEDSKDCEEYE
jgi:hypothetical protein